MKRILLVGLVATVSFFSLAGQSNKQPEPAVRKIAFTFDDGDTSSFPVYQYQSPVVPAGESIIWSMAKASGKFEPILRYPAEDSRYEQAKMDRLGL